MPINVTVEISNERGPAGSDATVNAANVLTAAQSMDAAQETEFRQAVNAAPATGILPSAIAGTAVITTDARLSDARTPTNAGLAATINASTEDTALQGNDRVPMTETGASGALRWMTLDRLFTFVRTQLGLMTGAVHAAGEWAFSSPTRPTSAGTGTPAANSLITRADGDARYPRLILAMATAVQDVTNSATLTPSTFLAATLEVGTYWIETLELVGSSAFASAGSKADLNFTGTGTFFGVRLRSGQNAAEPINSAPSWGGSGDSMQGEIVFPVQSQMSRRSGTLVVSAPGTLRVRFAQFTAVSGQFARLHVGSYLRAEKIA